MGYSVKWVEENLGITRKALRYYEKERLISATSSRNPENNYREFTEDDVERIWGIKLLIRMGYTAKEIYAIMHDPKFDFYKSISEKVAELEKQHDENLISLEFAKSIKFSGRIPTVTKIGNIRFDDFLAYCHENYNFYHDPARAPIMKVADQLMSNPIRDLGPNEIEQLFTFLEGLDKSFLNIIGVTNGYYQVIADMRELGHESDTVQRVVRLLHEYMIKSNFEPDVYETEQWARYAARSLIEGETAKMMETTYGKDGCLFIAKALAHYSGCNLDNL